MLASNVELVQRVMGIETDLKTRISGSEMEFRAQIQESHARSELVAAAQFATAADVYESKLRELVDVALKERRGRLHRDISMEIDEKLATVAGQLARQAEMSAAAGAREELEAWKPDNKREIREQALIMEELRSYVTSSQAQLEIAVESRFEDGFSALHRRFGAELK